MPQIRYCPNCGWTKRDDDYDANDRPVDELYCPECDGYELWSICWAERNGRLDYIEVLDWDENHIVVYRLDAIKSFLKKTLHLIKALEKREEQLRDKNA